MKKYSIYALIGKRICHFNCSFKSFYNVWFPLNIVNSFMVSCLTKQWNFPMTYFVCKVRTSTAVKKRIIQTTAWENMQETSFEPETMCMPLNPVLLTSCIWKTWRNILITYVMTKIWFWFLYWMCFRFVLWFWSVAWTTVVYLLLKYMKTKSFCWHLISIKRYLCISLINCT
jgi:hypothetical protein